LKPKVLVDTLIGRLPEPEVTQAKYTVEAVALSLVMVALVDAPDVPVTLILQVPELLVTNPTPPIVEPAANEAAELELSDVKAPELGVVAPTVPLNAEALNVLLAKLCAEDVLIKVSAPAGITTVPPLYRLAAVFPVSTLPDNV
jgi:hypothetical protein